MVRKRLFIAAPLPENYKTTINDLKNAQSFQYRWMEPENWHLTLMFLGDFPASHLESLQKMLKDFFAFQAPIHLQPKTFMFAPTLQKARMIWLRFYEDNAYADLCNKLFQELQAFYLQAGLPFNIPTHNRPIPHITLARFKTIKANNRLHLKNKSLVKTLPAMPLAQAYLYESVRYPDGAVYHPLSRFPFGKIPT